METLLLELQLPSTTVYRLTGNVSDHLRATTCCRESFPFGTWPISCKHYNSAASYHRIAVTSTGKWQDINTDYSSTLCTVHFCVHFFFQESLIYLSIYFSDNFFSFTLYISKHKMFFKNFFDKKRLITFFIMVKILID